MPGQNTSQCSRGNSDCTPLGQSELVPQNVTVTGRTTTSNTTQQTPPNSSWHQAVAPIERKDESPSSTLIRRIYKDKGFSEKATNIVLQSWRESSRKQYDTHIRKWLLFCTERETDPVQPTIATAVEFLTMLYDNGLSYSSINTARCALSAILDMSMSLSCSFGEHPMVKRFMKGIFQVRPQLPRYSKTWDVSIVLQHIKSMNETETLGLKELTLKFVMLVALTTAQRGQSLHLMDTSGMIKEEGSYTFLLGNNIKQSKPGNQSGLKIKLRAYPQDPKICVVHTCSVYLDRTHAARGNETKLFVTHQKPHGRASKDTIRRWIQQIMKDAGIDISIYKPHSARAASTSKAKANNASLLEIMNTAGWKSAATFATFYDKHIESEQSFTQSVLLQ